MCFQICVFSKGSGARGTVPLTKSRRNSRTRPRTQPQTRARTSAAAACEALPQPARKPTAESGKPPRSPQIAGCRNTEQPPRRKAARQITAAARSAKRPSAPSEFIAPLQDPIARNSATAHAPLLRYYARARRRSATIASWCSIAQPISASTWGSSECARSVRAYSTRGGISG